MRVYMISAFIDIHCASQKQKRHPKHTYTHHHHHHHHHLLGQFNDELSRLRLITREVNVWFIILKIEMKIAWPRAAASAASGTAALRGSVFVAPGTLLAGFRFPLGPLGFTSRFSCTGSPGVAFRSPHNPRYLTGKSSPTHVSHPKIVRFSGPVVVVEPSHGRRYDRNKPQIACFNVIAESLSIRDEESV